MCLYVHPHFQQRMLMTSNTIGVSRYTAALT